jgi:uncharacterized RDD family membrane protein YckC
VRSIATPEGVEIRFVLASHLRRVMAFALDQFLVFASAVALLIATLMATVVSGTSWYMAIFFVLLFVVRNLYFVLFEIRWRGRTPGKKVFGLRVVDRRGGALGASSLFVRNITRDLEIFIPLAAIFAPDSFWPGAPWTLQLFCAVWLLIVACLPLLNRDRLRAGDLLAGTAVVEEPRVHLLTEIHAVRTERPIRFRFRDEQLDMYGIYELQKLEEFLRQLPDRVEMVDVAATIARKLDWRGEDWRADPRVFLEDLYRQLRARREQRMLFGDRQERKKEGRLGDDGPPGAGPGGRRA